MSLKEAFEKFRRGPSDLVGIDVGNSGVKAVRLRAHGGDVTVLDTAILPSPIRFDENGEPIVDALDIPARLKATYAAISFTGANAIIKLLTFPGEFDEQAEAKVVQNMGLDEPDNYRIGYKIVAEGHGRGESRILTVAWPEEQAVLGPMMLPAGAPAPYSLEISGLATIAAFLHTLDEKTKNGAIGVLDFGDTATTYALFNRGVLTLIRRFGFGTGALLEKVQSTLGVDRETAQGIVMDGSFDISQSITEVLEPLIKQLVVSRDFVERRENCRVSHLFVSGGLAKSPDAVEDLRASLELEIEFWNPFDRLTIGKDAIAEELQGQEWRFAAAIGACLAVFEES